METAFRSLVKTVVYRVIITVLTAVAFILMGNDPAKAIGEIKKMIVEKNGI